MRTKVEDHIYKVIEQSRREIDEESVMNTGAIAGEQVLGIHAAIRHCSANLLQQAPQGDIDDFYSDQQGGMDVPQMIVDSIPQLQAQINQLSIMMQNTSLPEHVRHSSEMKYHQLQMQLQQAQALAATLAVATTLQQQQQQQQQQMQSAAGVVGYSMPGYQQTETQWPISFTNQQPAGQDSAYQRLPLNNRRRNLKRERPSDFLEVGGESDSKAPRYWE